MASTISIQSSGGEWRSSRDKDMYSDRYQMRGVKLCRVVGVVRPTTVQLSVDKELNDKGSLGRLSRKGLSCGWGSVARASILEPDGDLLEVSKGEVIR